MSVDCCLLTVDLKLWTKSVDCCLLTVDLKNNKHEKKSNFYNCSDNSWNIIILMQ